MKFTPPLSAAAVSTVAQEPAPNEGSDDFVLGDRYELGPLLGKGGMGQVFSAFDRVLGRDVALKEILEPTPALEARFKREAKLTAELDHPGIVPVYDAGRTKDGRLFYTMRLVRGFTLRALASQQQHATERLRLVAHVRDAARAVGHAHQRGIVHRDLKPDNVMVGPLGEVQVADWGLAQRLSELDASTGVVGTRGYLAPEVSSGGVWSPRADVFALGVVLRETLGDTHEQLPPELRAIVTRAVHARADARYADARALAEDLTAWLDGRPVSAHTYSPMEQLKRFVRTFRAPLTVAGIALFASSVGVGSAWRRALTERSAAQGANADLLTTQARIAIRAGALAEAWVMADKSNTLKPSAESAGVLAQLAAYQSPRLIAANPLSCEWVEPSADASAWLCAHEGKVTLHTENEVRWTVDGSVERAAFSANGRFVAAAARERGLVVIDVATGTQRVVDTLLVGALRAVGVSDDGTRAFATNNSWLRYVDGPTAVDCSGASVRTSGWQLVSLQGSGLLLSASDDGTWWRCSTLEWGEVPGPRLPPIDSRSMTTSMVALSADTWAMGSTEGQVFRLRAGAARERMAQLSSAAAVERLIRGAEPGTLWVVQSNGGPQLISETTGALLSALPARDRGPIVVRADGAVVSFSRARRAIWSIDGEPAITRQVFAHGLSSVARASSDGALFVAGSDGLVARVTRDGRHWVNATVGEAVIKDIAVGLGGRALATITAGVTNRLTVLDSSSLRPTAATINTGRHIEWLDDDHLWVAGYNELFMVTVDGGTNTPISTDGGAERLDWPSVAAPWVLNTRDEVWRLRHDKLEFVTHRLGARLVGGNAGLLAVADAAHVYVLQPNGHELAALPLSSSLTSMAASSDGRWLALGFINGSIEVFDVASSALLLRVVGHAERVAGLVFGGDGDLYSVSWDHSLQRVVVPGLPAGDVEARLGLSLADVVRVAPQLE